MEKAQGQELRCQAPATAKSIANVIYVNTFRSAWYSPTRVTRNQDLRILNYWQHSVPCTLGCMLDYGRWPKGTGTKPMSWGVAQGCDEYRRWRINHEGGKGAWHLMSGHKTLFQRNLRRRIRAFARLEVLDLMGRLKCDARCTAPGDAYKVRGPR